MNYRPLRQGSDNNSVDMRNHKAELIIKTIAFISGPALGHIGRLYEVAKQLKNHGDIKIEFIIPGFSGSADKVIKSNFKIHRIAVQPENRTQPFEDFANGLEALFTQKTFDLIVHDGCPVRWMSAVKFPTCPRVMITNAFLTGAYNGTTFQNDWFENTVREPINDIRISKGLKPLTSAYELYQADKVLLADFEQLKPILNPVPDNHYFCGPVSWTMTGALPAELEDRNGLMLISMGSTGKRVIDGDFIETIKQASGAANVVYAGKKADEFRGKDYIDLAFDWLPLDEVLDRSKITLSQGGSGSTYQALSRGVPVIIFPTHRNQEILGLLMEELGVGFCVDPDNPLEKLNGLDINRLSDNAKGIAQINNNHGAKIMADHILAML